MRKYVGLVLIGWLLASCSTATPDKGYAVDQETLDAYEEAGRQQGLYMKRYKDYLQEEVKAGRLHAVEAERLYRIEVSRLDAENKKQFNPGLTCLALPGGLIDCH